MLAVVPVRDGSLPSGGAETAAECSGRALLVGTGTRQAAEELGTGEVRLLELPAETGVAATAAALLTHLDDEAIVLPASPDGRDLAPRLAHALHRPLLAGAIEVTARGAAVSRWGGLAIEDLSAAGPFIATLQPGVRGVDPTSGDLRIAELSAPTSVHTGNDAVVEEVLAPDVSTMDLAEAPRILGGGAGLDSVERFAQLSEIATALGASMGATRVITDKGWAGHERQIGTTGVVVDPEVYVAFGISGAVQHTSGLGQPEHIISVNIDPHCPMMQLADLAIVADANAVLDALAAQLDLRRPEPEELAHDG
jgi:electron transfer flavoprotein alpha subunit